MSSICKALERQAPEAIDLHPYFSETDLSKSDTFGDTFDARHRDMSRMRLTSLLVLAYDSAHKTFSATMQFSPPLAACGACRTRSTACTCTYVLEFLSLEGPCLSVIQKERPHSEVALHGLLTHMSNALQGVPLAVGLDIQNQIRDASRLGGMAYLRSVCPMPRGGYHSTGAVPVTDTLHRLQDPTWVVFRPHYQVSESLLLLAHMASDMPSNRGGTLRQILEPMVQQNRRTACRMTPDVARAVERCTVDEETALMRTAYTAVMILANAPRAYQQPGGGEAADPTSVGTQEDPIIAELSACKDINGFSVDVKTLTSAHSPGTNLGTIARTAQDMVNDMYPCLVNGSELRVDVHLPSQAYADHIERLLKSVTTMSVGISVRLTYVVKRI